MRTGHRATRPMRGRRKQCGRCRAVPVVSVEHKPDFNHKLYHSERNLGEPFSSIEDAVAAAKRILCDDQHKAALRSA